MAKRENDPQETQVAKLILSLRSQGVTEQSVLSAIERTPRDLFTPDLFRDRAWEDSALPCLPPLDAAAFLACLPLAPALGESCAPRRCLAATRCRYWT